jgi:hypothetical protein
MTARYSPLIVDDLRSRVECLLLAARSLSQAAQRGPISPSSESNKFASQIRQVQFIRFRVIWCVTGFIVKSLICNGAQSN